MHIGMRYGDTTCTSEGDLGGRPDNMEETTTCVITKHDRIRLGNVDKTKSLTENFTTVISLYERARMTPAQIDAANPSEVCEAEWVIERMLEVLHDKVVSCDTCIYECNWNVPPCDGCLDFSEWEQSQEMDRRWC